MNRLGVMVITLLWAVRAFGIEAEITCDSNRLTAGQLKTLLAKFKAVAGSLSRPTLGVCRTDGSTWASGETVHEVLPDASERWYELGCTTGRRWSTDWTCNSPLLRRVVYVPWPGSARPIPVGIVASTDGAIARQRMRQLADALDQLEQRPSCNPQDAKSSAGEGWKRQLKASGPQWFQPQNGSFFSVTTGDYTIFFDGGQSADAAVEVRCWNRNPRVDT